MYVRGRCDECGLWKLKRAACDHCISRPNRIQAYDAMVKEAVMSVYGGQLKGGPPSGMLLGNSQGSMPIKSPREAPGATGRSPAKYAW